MITKSTIRTTAILAAALALASVARADQPLPPILEGIGVDEKLGQTIDLDLTFTAENGYQKALREYFHKDRPVILNLVYYTCPMLCNLVLNAQTSVLKQIPWMPGEEFEVVTVSINPGETFDLAQKKKAVYLSEYDRPAPGWHFLSDYEDHAKKLAAQIGFHYRWDPKLDQFAHPAVIMVLTPDGKISRYLYGIKFKPLDVRLALTEAAAGKWSQTLDRILLFCYHYDPQTHSYTMFATNVMRTGGVFTVLLMGFFIWRMLRREQARSRISAAGVGPAGPAAPDARPSVSESVVSEKGMVPAK
ncbi:MAG: SCO family protein [Bryobacteraceae bacterium]